MRLVNTTREYVEEANNFIPFDFPRTLVRLMAPSGAKFLGGVRLVLAPLVTVLHAFYTAFRRFLVWNWVLPAALSNAFVDEQVRQRGKNSLKRTITFVAVMLRILVRSTLVVVVYVGWKLALSLENTPDRIADSFLLIWVVATVATSVGVTARHYRGVFRPWVRVLLLAVAALPVVVASPFLFVIGAFGIVVLPPAQFAWFVIQHVRLVMSELTWDEPRLVPFMRLRPQAFQRAWKPPLYSIWFANILNDSDGLLKERPVVVIANDELRGKSVVMYFTSQDKRDGTLGYEEFELTNASKRNFLNTRDVQHVRWDDLRLTDLSLTPVDKSRVVTIAARRTVR